MQKLKLYLALLTVTLALPAQAYIGPGAGAGTIAVVFGVIVSIFLAFVAILWYPLKRLLKRRKASAKSIAETQPDDT